MLIVFVKASLTLEVELACCICTEIYPQTMRAGAQKSAACWSEHTTKLQHSTSAGDCTHRVDLTRIIVILGILRNQRDYLLSWEIIKQIKCLSMKYFFHSLLPPMIIFCYKDPQSWGSPRVRWFIIQGRLSGLNHKLPHEIDKNEFCNNSIIPRFTVNYINTF